LNSCASCALTVDDHPSSIAGRGALQRRGRDEYMMLHLDAP
jgi:hypothetical protein